MSDSDGDLELSLSDNEDNKDNKDERKSTGKDTTNKTSTGVTATTSPKLAESKGNKSKSKKDVDVEANETKAKRRAKKNEAKIEGKGEGRNESKNVDDDKEPSEDEEDEEKVKAQEALQVMNENLFNSKYSIYSSGFSLFLTIFLSVYALLSTGDQSTHIVVALSTVGMCGWVSKSIYDYSNVLEKVYEHKQNDEQSYKWYSDYTSCFKDICDKCIYMMFLTLGVFGITLGSVIFQLNTSDNSVGGIYASFNDLTKNGKAIFILLHLNLIYSLISLGLARHYSVKMYEYYSDKKSGCYYLKAIKIVEHK